MSSCCPISQLCVDPAHRRRGHGRALVAAAVECALAAGIRDLQTGVWAFNEPSLCLFRDQGFRMADVRLFLTPLPPAPPPPSSAPGAG
ncbi:MAG: GNAT family N-acetyltransferase [Candidatus Latescibacterota bacterium]